jgi:hypothetical protein
VRDEQALVRDVLRQGVLEDVGRLLGFGLLVDELQPLQLQQVRVDPARAFPDRPEQPERELTPEDRRRLEHASGPLVESVHPRGEDALHGIRHGDLRAEVVVLRDGLGELLQEERVPLRPPKDGAGERLRDLFGPQDRTDDGQRVVG